MASIILKFKQSKDMLINQRAAGGKKKFLEVSTSSLSFAGGNGSSQNITVTSNVAWTASRDQSWMSLSASSGSGNGIITVSVSANAGVARNALITISGESITRTVSVSQEARVENIVRITSTGEWNKPSGVNAIDVFLVGGGGGTGALVSTNGGGGGGGYTTLRNNLNISSYATLHITIGNGGAGSAFGATANDGGTTYLRATNASGTVLSSANGGKGTNQISGGNGGSGGAGGSSSHGNGLAGIAGTNGGNGGNGNNGNNPSYGGTGQGTSTICPFDNIPYGGGGGGGANTNGSGSSGGYYGGGNGTRVSGASAATAGIANTGGGGGGHYASSGTGQSGGSGIVIIRYYT